MSEAITVNGTASAPVTIEVAWGGDPEDTGASLYVAGEWLDAVSIPVERGNEKTSCEQALAQVIELASQVGTGADLFDALPAEWTEAG